MKLSILVVDDDKLVNEFIAETLGRTRHEVTTAYSGEEAKALLEQDTYDIVLTDIKMQKISGMDLLRLIKERTPETVVIMITAFGTVKNAVEAMKIGAFDYLIKPSSPDEIELAINRAHDLIALRSENRRLRTEAQERYKELVGESTAMNKIKELIGEVAPTRSTVMISGESGTGKELIARAIHYQSDRAEMPFVKTNCAALPEGLIESELFGHEKGAFTGADRQKRGRFEMSDGGTILLDEISEISTAMQGKLLRVLQDGEFHRVGGERAEKVDVRVLVASNRNLSQLVEEGRFRKDLFYRLSVVRLHLPPLRERREDIPLLIRHFLEKAGAPAGSAPKRVAAAALARLCAYAWPGNVRELENEITRAAAFAGPTIEVADLALHIQSGQDPSETIRNEPDSLRVRQRVERLERQLIREAMHRAQGNQTRAAMLLGLSRFGLQKKLRRYNLGG